jgi:predicted DNA-binding protein with PD1-like motif
VRVFPLADQPVRTFAVVFTTGEEPMGGLLQFASQHDVTSAALTAVGAFANATLAWYDLEAQTYRDIPVDEQVEVSSLVGDISLVDGHPKVHAHAVVSRRDGSTVAGHVRSASVRPTLEVMVTESPGKLVRKHDPATGLALLALPDEAP